MTSSWVPWMQLSNEQKASNSSWSWPVTIVSSVSTVHIGAPGGVVRVNKTMTVVGDLEVEGSIIAFSIPKAPKSMDLNRTKMWKGGNDLAMWVDPTDLGTEHWNRHHIDNVHYFHGKKSQHFEAGLDTVSESTKVKIGGNLWVNGELVVKGHLAAKGGCGVKELPEWIVEAEEAAAEIVKAWRA